MGELASDEHVKYILYVENVGMTFLQFSSCSLVHFLPVTGNDLVFLDLLPSSISEFTDMSFWVDPALRKRIVFELLVMEHFRLNEACWG
ncbi:hypothetical protein EUGRSUZ_G01575 [Eucalyptus grandis]|uniref:Uncharacterized protein n=2 Tax=Eucalyptus grandis TaxID=71139 RepID=A0A059BDF0_EUCGR|nr:hypothetical protein EUGRSUZ_G01575 [Eucalyptus grandis]